MFDLKGLSYELKLLLKDKFDSLSTDEEVSVLTSGLSDRISSLEGGLVTIEQVNNAVLQAMSSVLGYDDGELRDKVTVLEGLVGTSSIEGLTLTNAFSVLRNALSTYRNSNKDLDAIKNLLGELETLV